MRLHLSADDLLSTTRAVRMRLDLERAVERSVVEECVELAMQAPSGSNSQRWSFIVVESAEKKSALAELYRRSYTPYRAASSRFDDESDPRAERFERVMRSADYLAENFQRVPLILIPAIEERLDDGASVMRQAGMWGSLLPAAWSFMLAARERGLGTSWSTLHLKYELEAAEILSIPYDTVTQGGMFPIAYTRGTSFQLGHRRPVDEVLHWDGW